MSMDFLEKMHKKHNETGQLCREITELFQSHEKLIIGAIMELFRLDHNTGADIEFAGFFAPSWVSPPFFGGGVNCA